MTAKSRVRKHMQKHKGDISGAKQETPTKEEALEALLESLPQGDNK